MRDCECRSGFWRDQQQCVVELHIRVAKLEPVKGCVVFAVRGSEEATSLGVQRASLAQLTAFVSLSRVVFLATLLSPCDVVAAPRSR